jgi:hypothetical protein
VSASPTEIDCNRHHAGWRVDIVHEKVAGKKYGKRQWVMYRVSAYRGGYEFDPKD